MAWHEKVIDMTLTGISLTFNFSIICLMLTTRRENWRRMDVYVLSLSTVDFVYTFGIPVRTYVTVLDNNNWPFGEIGCKLYNAMDVACMSISVNILVIMSLERYSMINSPMRRQTMKFYWSIVKALVALVIGIALSYPMFSISEQMIFDLSPENGTMLQNGTELNISEVAAVWDAESPDYPEGVTLVRCLTGFSHIEFQKGYEVFIYFAIFFIPGAIIAVCYTMLVKSFRNATNISGNDSNQALTESRLSQVKRLSRMVLIIVACYMACFLPFGTLRMAQFIKPFDINPNIVFVFVSMTYLNASMNPVLYTFLSNRYQKRIKGIFRKIFKCQRFQRGQINRAAGRNQINPNSADLKNGNKKSSSGQHTRLTHATSHV